MRTTPFILFAALLTAACNDPLADLELEGALSLSLSTIAGGVEYRLRDGHFQLDGPLQRELESGDEPSLLVPLPAGTYTLTLREGYTLTREGDASAQPVVARLVSQNPASVSVSAGQTARVTFRFELTPAPAAAADGGGSLAIDLAVHAPDAGPPPPSCEAALRIDELDYEQTGSDDAEFVELFNASAGCAAQLDGLALELVNGGDGKVYARYDLSALAAALPAGARLVLGDPAVLSALPAGTLSVMLNGSGLQNGPDGLRLVRGERVLDVLLYEGAVPGLSGTTAPADDETTSLARCGAGGEPFRASTPTPGRENACGA